MFDVVINNGSIIDPVNGECQGNIGVTGGKIALISPEPLRGRNSIDAQGKKVSPGFIDIHMHEDKIEDGRIKYEGFNSMVLMGVTTCVGGNCGLGSTDIDLYRQIIDRQGCTVNYAGLIGHAALREKVGCADRYRPATKEQINEMSKILQDGLEKGALGLSFGIEYTPGVSITELIQLSSVVSAYPNRMVSAHYRFDANRALEALAELIIVAREAQVKFQISHLGSCTAFGKTEEALPMLETAHTAGADIGIDCYPYDAFCTYIGSAAFDPGCFEKWGVGFEALKIAEGKYKGEQCTAEIFKYLRENEPDAFVIAFVMNEKEVIKTLQHPLVMVGSDGHVKNGQGHPRSAGTFPRVLGRFTRDNGYLDLVSAINKMTNMPAQRLGLDSKGRIKEGSDADLTIFDYDTIIDRATYENPTFPPAGIESVLIGGTEVVRHGQLTSQRPGVFLSY